MNAAAMNLQIARAHKAEVLAEHARDLESCEYLEEPTKTSAQALVEARLAGNLEALLDFTIAIVEESESELPVGLEY